MRHRQAFLGAALLAAALAGCSAEPLHPEAAYAPPKRVQVEWRVERHAVTFPVGSDRPSPGELVALDRFLASAAGAQDAQVYIDAGPAVVGRELAAHRFAALDRHLAAQGIAARPMIRDEAGGPTDSDPRRATVYVGRFVAVAPACPDWRKPTAADFTNTPSSNFGCATAVNFGQMLANPGDLVRGHEPGPADGDRAARAIQRYREGEKNGKQDGAAGSGTSMTTGAGGAP